MVIVVGTDHHPFERLVEWADDWATRHPDDAVFVQHGYTEAPRVAHGQDFLPASDLRHRLGAANVVITHGGPGTLADARASGHHPIVVPRDPRLGEHVDAHQQRFTTWAAPKGLCRVARTVEELESAVLDQPTTRCGQHAGLTDVARTIDRFETLLGRLMSSPAGPAPVLASAPASLRFRETVRRDLRGNIGYPKSVVVLFLLRITQAAKSSTNPLARLTYPALATVYKILSEWVLGVEIPPSTTIGPGLRLRHAVGVVVNPATVIGSDVLIRQGVTLGNRRSARDCPVIENGAEIGAGATIIGAVRVGARAKIGAGVVVTKDIPAGASVSAPPPIVRLPRDDAAPGQ